MTEPGSLGVVIGGSGNGEQIAANKVPGVRAALVWNTATAQLARQHNDANVVSIGARQHSAEEATELVLEFLRTPFSERRAARPPDRPDQPTTSATGTARPAVSPCRPAAAGRRESELVRAPGVTGQPNAVAARVTAPGLTSVTRPAACSEASETPPR